MVIERLKRQISSRVNQFTAEYMPGKINLHISIPTDVTGGGSSTFAKCFARWCSIQTDIHLQPSLAKADAAIVIANKVSFGELKKAKANGCFVLHRLDERVEKNESPSRQKKHASIRAISALADVTVYQSQFVFENMHPYLGKPYSYAIIHNGAFRDEFYPPEQPGEMIGHVTWGVGEKKRLDLVFEKIKTMPEQQFLLVGNHSQSEFPFADLPNAVLAGPVGRDKLLECYHQMKLLYFPSENDPCPNTVVESIMAGVPVCYNPNGGTVELVKDCGLPLDEFDQLWSHPSVFRENTLSRPDLSFELVAQKYFGLLQEGLE